MRAQAWDFLRDGRWFRWLTGPILEKELRCASRRRRNYVLRTLYVLLLTIVLLLIIGSMPETLRSSLYSQPWRVARLEELGRVFVLAIAWFQFLALQLVAMVLLSTAVSDEIYRRTLGTLMTTPVTSLQIVMGKLLGRMLQLLLLLAISVPPLLLLRVLGGIPWEFELAAVAVTFSMLLFVASLTMFFSILNRHAYVVIFATLISLAVLFVLLPWLVGYVMDASGVREMQIIERLAPFNPYIMLGMLTQGLMSPGRFLGYETFWAGHCGCMLAASALVIAACVMLVRRVAHLQIIGAPIRLWHRRARDAAGVPAHEATATSSRVRHVTGAPVLWRELRQPFLRGRILPRVLAALALATLLGTYALAYRDLGYRDTHCVYLTIFTLLGMLITAITGASPIPAEKEAQTLPLLLTTTQTSSAIIAGKFLGALRRCLPVWLLVAVHLIFFAPFGYVAWFVPVLMGFLIVGVTCFQTGTGLFLGAAFKRTTTAVVLNLLLGLAVWALVPLLLALLDEGARPRTETAEYYLYAHPLVQTVVIAGAGCGSSENPWSWRPGGIFQWPHGSLNPGTSTSIIIASSALYVLAGLGAARMAAAVLRQRAP